MLAAQALACRRGDRLLFSAFDLEVHPGQVVWVRGANGRGKTSLLRLLAGLSRPESGRIRWGSEALSEASGTPRQVIYLGHANALKDDLSVQESLRFLARLHGRSDDPGRLAEALRQCGVYGHRDVPVRALSQGQRRRVALARLCLETAAALWILDEPFDALDNQGVETVNSLLERHARRGGSVVLTSHVPLTLTHPQPIIVSLDNAAA